MTTESPLLLTDEEAADSRDLAADQLSVSSADDDGDRWQQPPSRWAWWMFVSALAVACTLFVVNWIGWDNLSVAARLIVLVELFLVACLVLFLVLGERFSEWAGYGSLWSTDPESRDTSRDSVSRADRNWSRTAQLKQYLRRTYYEVRCHQSTVLPQEWRRRKPASASPQVERQGQNSPHRREPVAPRSKPVVTPPVQAAPGRQNAVNRPGSPEPQPVPVPPVAKAPALEASQAIDLPGTPATPKTCRPHSRIEIRRRQ